MRYIIYGAGAVGGTIAGRLQQAGQNVVMIARGEHLRAVQERGLLLRTPEGDYRLAVPAVGHPRELTFAADDVVLLTMKGNQTSAALDDLEAAGGYGLPIVCCQNGVGNEPLVARRFLRVYGMVVLLPATFLEAGVVLGFGTPNSGVLDCGVFPSGVDDLIGEVAAGISGAHFVSRAVPDVMRLKYAKLLSNLENGVNAAIGDAPGDEAKRAFARRLRDEARAVYAAAGVAYTDDAEFAQRVRGEYGPGSIPNAPRGGSSTWQSLARGHDRLETDFLNGEIMLLGRLAGVATPYNAAVRQLSQQLAAAGLPPGSRTIADLQALAERFGAEPSRADA
jgi:2-dehydropantoate 2-reductase